jgi:AraC-like DNA-binding protein
MKQLWMQRFQVNLPHVNAVRMMSGRRVIGFLTDGHQPAMQHCGMRVSPGDIIVNDFDVVHQKFGADIRYGSISLTLDDFDAAYKSFTGCDFLGQRRLVRPNPEFISLLLNLHESVGQIAKTSPDILAQPEAVRALEQELIHAVLRCFTEGTSTKRTVGQQSHDKIIGRFEEFLEANAERPLYLTDICAAIGVAERTLRVACEERLGMGPIRYLKLRRMHLVRRVLLRADSSEASVTRIATDHGFWELGRFAVAYRKLFGESPSVSLQRPC